MATPIEWMAPDDAEPMPVDEEEEVLSFPAGLKSTPCNPTLCDFLLLGCKRLGPAPRLKHCRAADNSPELRLLEKFVRKALLNETEPKHGFHALLNRYSCSTGTLDGLVPQQRGENQTINER